MLLHLLQSKTQLKDNDAGDVIADLHRAINIVLVKHIENDKDLYILVLDFGNNDDAKETHDTEESARSSLNVILNKLGCTEDLAQTITIREVVKKSAEERVKEIFKKALCD